MLELEARYDRARRSRIFVMESHETPFWGDPADIVELLQAANANVIRFPATAWITTYYPSSYLPQYPGLGDRDLLRDMCDAAQGTGIAVVPYNHIGVLHTAAYREHPEWAATDYDGRPLRWSGPDWDAGLHYATCLSNPAFREAYSKAMAELVANYDPEMIYFDGPVWYLLCQCRHCRRAFLEAYGRELPRIPPPNVISNQESWPGWAWEDETWPLWFELRYRTAVTFMQSLSEAIKSVKDIPVIFNCNVEQMGTRGSGSVPERTMEYAEGALTTEVHRSASGLGGQLTGAGGSYMGIIAQTKIGVAMGKAAWCYCPPGPYFMQMTEDSLDPLLFGYSYYALGGTPIIQTLHGFMRDRDAVPVVRRLHDIGEQFEDYFYGFEAVPFVSLPYNRATGDWYGRERPVERFSLHWHGAFKALTHSHHQFMPALDRDLSVEGLQGTKVLYLENVACIGDQQADAIRDFVAAGGGLVATYETSLYDERGHKRDDFALSDLFGVHYKATLDWEDASPGTKLAAEALEAYIRVTQLHGVTVGIRLGKAINFGSRRWRTSHGETTLVSEPRGGAASLAEVFLPREGGYGAPLAFPYGRPPGIVANSFGKGKVVYFAPAVGKAYCRWANELLRVLIANAVRWVSDGQEPFAIEAPNCVIAHMTEERGGIHRLLHLINYTGNRHENSARRVHYVPPIENIPIKVRIPEGHSVRSVSVLNTGDDIRFRKENESVSFVLPRLGLFASVLISLE